MRLRKYTSTGIVLARRNYSEADRILVIFSRDFGKLNLLAKGVRKLASRKRGSLEIFSHIRFSASKGKGLDFLLETESIDNFEKIRKDMKRALLAYYFVEVIGRISQEDKKQEKLYHLLYNILKKLEKERKLRKLRHDFVYQVLVVSGFWPEGEKIADVDKELDKVLEHKVLSQKIGRDMLL